MGILRSGDMSRTHSLLAVRASLSFAGLLCTLHAGAGCTNPPPRSAAAQARAPQAEQHPHVVHAPAGDRDDPYYWLRDDSRTEQRVLAYLNAENAYADGVMAPLRDDADRLYEEMVARLPAEDVSAPVRDRGYEYVTRYVRGGEHALITRRALRPNAAEETLLDGNALAVGKSFFRLGSFELSDDGRFLAWTEDDVGRSEYTLHVKDLASGALVADTIAGVDEAVVWTADGRSLLYVEKDPETLLGMRVKRHRLGNKATEDNVVYEEKDHAFYLALSRSPSRRLIFVHASATLSSEQWYADAADPNLQFRVILPRAADHIYSAEDHGEIFIVRSNLAAPNYRLLELPMGQRSLASARELVAEPAAGLIEDFAVFDSAIAYEARSEGRLHVLVRNFADGAVHGAPHDEPVFTEALDENPDPSADYVQVRYSTLSTPETVYRDALRTGQRTLLKRDDVLGDFVPDALLSERLEVEARDGTRVPVSLVYARGHAHDGSAPLYLTGYGAYGLSEDPEFSSARLSLLHRGVVFAIAHVRGGQELGRAWYDAGRLLQKENTFRDFIDVTDALAARGVAHRARIAARGASAGGLLIGAVANMAPDRYRVMVAHVPFVDVVTTMLDPSIPLTTNEYDEWGNPEEKRYYDAMLAYSPYDNVRAQAYPAMFVSTGLWDSQVQYYEPAKWVARLRARKTDDQPLVLRTQMEAGHGGRSGRFARRRELAEEYAFVLRELGVPVR